MEENGQNIWCIGTTSFGFLLAETAEVSILCYLFNGTDKRKGLSSQVTTRGKGSGS